MQQVSLFFSSDTFKIDGITYIGMPLYVRTETMQIDFLLTEFSIYRCLTVGTAQSSKTWRDIAYILHAYVRYMYEHKLDWQKPTEETIAHYRHHLEQPRFRAHESAGQPPTVRVRNRRHRIMSIVCDFYDWQVDQGYLSSVPFSKREVLIKNPRLLSHLSGSRRVHRPTIVPATQRNSARIPRYFTFDERQRISNALNDRDRLIYEWALFSGVREFELAALLVSQIPAQDAYRSRRLYRLKLLVDKYSKGEYLTVPTWLLDKTYRYVRLFGRPAIGKAAMRRGRKTEENIFLGRWGTALQPDSIYRNFKKTLRSIGLEGTFHDLRHTFAINTLDKLMATERHASTTGHNALLELKWRMRHESFETLTVYLRAREAYLSEVDSDLWDADG